MTKKENNGEIDLYDLIDILVRQKIVIAATIGVVCLLSLGGALYERSTKYDREAINFKIRQDKLENDFYFQKANLVMDRFDYRDIFFKKEVVDQLFTIPQVEKLYEKSFSKDERTTRTRREFIQKSLVVEAVKDKETVEYLTAIASLKGDKKAEAELLEKYIDILNEEKKLRIDRAIENQYEKAKMEEKESYDRLKKLESEVNKLADDEKNSLSSDSKISIIEILTFKYPTLIAHLNEEKETYIKYNSELIGIQGVKKEINNFDFIERVSDTYVIKRESKAKMILAGGIVLGIFMGIFVGLLKEFVDGYKKRRKD